MGAEYMPGDPMTPMRPLILALLLAPCCASATVASVTAQGFLLRHEVSIAAPPAKVYDTIVNIGSWWSPSHTYTKNAANLSIEPRAGGCFCERFPDGGFVEHMRVVYAAPGAALRLSGALGPLAAHGLAGSLTVRLAPAGEGTALVLTYSVGGFMEGGFEKMAPAVDGMWAEQVRRLKSFIEAR